MKNTNLASSQNKIIFSCHLYCYVIIRNFYKKLWTKNLEFSFPFAFSGTKLGLELKTQLPSFSHIFPATKHLKTKTKTNFETHDISTPKSKQQKLSMFGWWGGASLTVLFHLWESLVVEKIGIRIAREFGDVIC